MQPLRRASRHLEKRGFRQLNLLLPDRTPLTGESQDETIAALRSREEQVMRYRVGLGFGALALAGAIAAATLLAFATGGNAASSKACVQTGSTANCVVVSVA